MARYLQTAAQANKLAQQALQLVSPEDRPLMAEAMARMFNYGFRCNPRAASGTIRINALNTAFKGTPVKCSLERRTGHGGRKYNALVTVPQFGDIKTVDIRLVPNTDTPTYLNDESGEDE